MYGGTTVARWALREIFYCALIYFVTADRVPGMRLQCWSGLVKFALERIMHEQFEALVFHRYISISGTYNTAPCDRCLDLEIWLFFFADDNDMNHQSLVELD